MNKDLDENYLRRNLQTRVDEAHVEASRGATATFRKANAAGSLNSGNTLITINDEMKSLFTTRIESMSKFLFNAVGRVDERAAELLSEYGEKLVQMIGEAVNSLYGASLARGLTGINLRMSNELLDLLRNEKLRVVDDYQHGMLGDVALKRDPIVSVTSTITNSPGAVQQSGIGRLSQDVLQQQASHLIDALNSFLAAEEVRRLNAEHQQALEDLADVLRSELQKPQPEPAKIKRWWDRLSALASDFGVQTSAGTLGTVLADLLGY